MINDEGLKSHLNSNLGPKVLQCPSFMCPYWFRWWLRLGNLAKEFTVIQRSKASLVILVLLFFAKMLATSNVSHHKISIYQISLSSTFYCYSTFILTVKNRTSEFSWNRQNGPWFPRLQVMVGQCRVGHPLGRLSQASRWSRSRLLWWRRRPMKPGPQQPNKNRPESWNSIPLKGDVGIWHHYTSFVFHPSMTHVIYDW